MPFAETLEAFRRGDNDEAGRLARLDLDTATGANDQAGQVDALCMLARVALRGGDLAEVAARAAEAQRIAQAAGERRLERMPIHLQAVAARMSGDSEKARALYQRSIALNEEVGDMWFAAVEHRNQAYAELQAGHETYARELFAECRRRLDGQETGAFAPYLIFDDAAVAALDRNFDLAETKLRQAKAEFAAAGVIPDPDDAIEITRLEERLRQAGGGRR